MRSINQRFTYLLTFDFKEVNIGWMVQQKRSGRVGRLAKDIAEIKLHNCQNKYRKVSGKTKYNMHTILVTRLHHRPRQDETVLVLFISVVRTEFEAGQNSFEIPRQKTLKQFCPVSNPVHTADTEKTRLSSLVLSASVV